MHRQILKRTQKPSDVPVTLADIKADLRIQHAAEDELLHSLISAAADFLDAPNGAIGKALISQEWEVSVPCFDRHERIELPITPVMDLLSVQYYDADNNSQTMDVADFYLLGSEDWAYIEAKPDVTVPGVYDRADAITVTFKAGFGANESAVPGSIKQAMRLMVAHWYENRSAVVIGASVAELPMAAQALINMNRKGWVA